jgi:hypothetical protein
MSLARALAAVCFLSFAFAVGCGSDDGGTTPPVEGPLPTGPEDPRAYTESFVSRNPGALVQLEHLVLMQLEATAEEERDTCSETDGVDCVSYVVEEPTRLELSIADDLESLDELLLIEPEARCRTRRDRRRARYLPARAALRVSGRRGGARADDLSPA